MCEESFGCHANSVTHAGTFATSSRHFLVFFHQMTLRTLCLHSRVSVVKRTCPVGRGRADGEWRRCLYAVSVQGNESCVAQCRSYRIARRMG